VALVIGELTCTTLTPFSFRDLFDHVGEALHRRYVIDDRDGFSPSFRWLRNSRARRLLVVIGDDANVVLKPLSVSFRVGGRRRDLRDVRVRVDLDAGIEVPEFR